MSCLNPNLMKCSVDPESGALYYKFLGNGRYSDPKDYGTFDDLAERGFFYISIPCRHCLGCHIDYSREWANRMLLELKDNPKAIFVTLTYNPESVPKTDNGVLTLNKRDVQLFFKRLRKHFVGVTIRYFIAGEYGPKTYRPHYHAIIYGLSLSDFNDLRYIGCNEIKDPYFSSPLFEKIWSNGFVQMSSVNYKTCAYVARYVLKKHYKKNIAELNGAEQEFTLSSRRPGIGLCSVEILLIKSSDYIFFSGDDGVRQFRIPKSLIKKGKTLDGFIDKCTEMIYTRFNEANLSLSSELEWSGDTYDFYLRKQAADLRKRIFKLPERM